LFGSPNIQKSNVNPKFLGFILLVVYALVSNSLAAQEKDDYQDNQYKLQSENSNQSQTIEGNNGLVRERDVRDVRDTAAVRSAPATVAIPEKKSEASNQKSNKAEDETLSYNFLYFIIQKFKVTDMTDD
jgi:hypothetical protein